jgi:hypothetical protein
MREIHDLLFEKATDGMTAEEVLNYYRNLYYAEPQSTEHGIVANALNDILPRMIVPPCKVGDTVYMVTQNGEIWWLEVLGAQMTVGINGQGAHWTRWCFVCADAIMFKDEDIGKTIFITHKESEQALKGGAE